MTLRILLCLFISLAPVSGFAQALTPVTALKTALRHNPRFKEVGLAVSERERLLEGQEGIRPWIFKADAGFNFQEQPLSGVIEEGVRESTFGSLTAQILKQLVWGTQLSLRFDFNRSSALVPFTVPSLGISDIRQIGPNYGNALEFRFTQPLLKGFGRDINDLPKEISAKQLGIAKLRRIQTGQVVAAELLTAYWNWIRATLELESHQMSLARTQTMNELTLAQIEAGQLAELERDIIAQRLSVAEQTVLLAELQVRDRFQDLETLMGLPLGGEPAAAPTELPDINVEIPSLDAILTRAMDTSPDLLLVEQDIQVNRLTLKRDEDTTKPQLDVIGTLAQTALSDQVPDAFEQLLTAQLTTVFIGLSLTWSINNDLAEQQLDADQIAVERAVLRKVETKRQIERNVRQSRRLLVTQQQRLVMSEKEVVLARKNVGAVNEKYAAGLATYLEVIELERALSGAELRNAQARIDVYLAAVALRRITGTLLESYGLELE